MRNYRIHFIRHGMTSNNQQGQYIGCRTDAELSIQGIRDLIAIKEKMPYPEVEVVYTSPMARCCQTAGVLYPAHEFLTVPQLREMDFGDFEGKTIEDLKDSEDYQKWIANSMTVAPPNGESGEDFLARVIEGFQYIIRDMMNADLHEAAVITHGGVIMTLLAGIGLPRRSMFEWHCENGEGYTCLVNAQLWFRDGLIEVADFCPQPPVTEEEEALEDYGWNKV